jgi:capsular exopolysaccharide synthesis family protein
MGKTYEAYLKSKKATPEDTFIPYSINDWQCPNLLDTASIAALAQRVAVDSQKENRTVLNFVSCRSREGTSTIIVNLAKFLTKTDSGKTVLLIDANVNHPVLHLAFSTPIGVGFSDFLIQKAQLSDIIYGVENTKIQIIPRGLSSAVDYSTLEQKVFQNLISTLKERYSYLLIDSSPFLTSAGSLPLLIGADSIFLIVQAHMTQWEVIAKTKNILNDYNCHIDAVVLNKVKKVIPNWLYKRL